MIKHYQKYLPANIDTYIEPFFGGGAVYCYIYEKYNPSVCIINDINSDVMSIYKSIKKDVETFSKYIRNIEKKYLPLSYDERKKFYYDLRNKHAYEYTQWSDVKQAAVLYSLMVLSFNGIFQINKNTNNRFGTPCGLLKEKDSLFDYDNIHQWSTALQKTIILSGDWQEAVHSKENSFIFLDPPYRDCFTSYGQVFDDEHQSTLLNFCRKTGNKIFLCNKDSGDGFFDLIDPLKKIEIKTTHTAGRRKRVENGHEAKKVTEIMMYNTK